MLRVGGRMRILHVTGRALRGIWAGHGAVLLGYEPGTRARLRLNKATISKKKNVLAFLKCSMFVIKYILGQVNF